LLAERKQSLTTERARVPGAMDPDGTAIVMSSELLPAPTPDPRVTWNYFDEQGWVWTSSFAVSFTICTWNIIHSRAYFQCQSERF